MAQREANQNNRRERIEAREEEMRQVRRRVDHHDRVFNATATQMRRIDLSVQQLQAPLGWVLKGFESPIPFWPDMQADFARAKSSFVVEFLNELRTNTGPALHDLMLELEDNMMMGSGAAILGVFKTGGYSALADWAPSAGCSASVFVMVLLL